MIFKVSLFLATISAASARMRGQATEQKEHAGRHLMSDMMGMGMGASVMAGGDAPITSVRSIDGSENPLAAPDAELQRLSGPAHYPDGQGLDVSMFTEPNARLVSNAVATMPDGVERAPVSDIFWQWGQFMDHDYTLAEGIDEPADIIVTGDPDGLTTIPFARAVHHFTPDLDVDPEGVREQLNEITGFVDGSMVYGSSTNRETFLREFSGGRMKMQADDVLLPFGNTDALGGDAFTPPEINIGGPFGDQIDDILFVGGDPRVNEQPGLTAIHTLFVREHNRVAGILDSVFDDSDENIFQLARKVVIGTIQRITYNEFLPLLIGDFAPDPNSYSFDSNVNPGVAQEFAACAFRVGHTFLSGDLLLHNGIDATGSLNLVDGFFNPQMFIDFPGLIDEVLIGQTNQAANAADMFVIDEVRTNLFGVLASNLGTASAGTGLDLVALNIQRARDHGINKYNEVRAGYGLDRKANFNEVSSDPEVVSRLTTAYGGNNQQAVDLCDPWICGLAETPESGLLGEMFSVIIGDQFTRSMNGDQFFYTGDADLLDPGFIGVSGIDVFTRTLADVLNDNTIGGVAPNAMEI